MKERIKYNCPKCGKITEYGKDKYFPFCSYRCKILDLGAWAEEEYKISREIKDSDIEQTEF